MAEQTDVDHYALYVDDARVLAAIGAHVVARTGRVAVRLPRAVAEAAVAAWEREDVGEVPGEETLEQWRLRDMAGDLGLIGVAFSERGRWEGEEVVVELDVALAGAAAKE
ncbi:hypothetical protein ACTWP5_04765 [Streptomyces sp. 4N509B]|uniref:hypothetical protein n=1 Tax=Streptomyces sp. 4N509B TaxID=3457413 RepID=UPI003FD1DD8F